MAKRQKRFKSEQAILKAIDAMEAKRQHALETAEALESSMTNLALHQQFNERDRENEIDYRRKMAGVARRSAQRAESKKVKLGKALSAFRTLLLPLAGNEDTSVVL